MLSHTTILETFPLCNIYLKWTLLFKVFVNGDMVQEEKGQGFLSQDWGGKAGIGKCSLDTKINHA